jgi:RNA polymerase sigma-70 factor (ECF subfamily)
MTHALGVAVSAAGQATGPLQPDATLVAGTLRGDTAAFEELVRRYDRPVRATCFATLRHWHAAQDAAQDAFLKAFTSLGSLRDPARFGPWLLTIAHHQAQRAARAGRWHQSLDASPASASAPAPDEGAGDLLQWVSRLPEHERAVVVLRYVEGLDVVAIARLRSCPTGTITKQLSRAHKRLEKLLDRGALR